MNEYLNPLHTFSRNRNQKTRYYWCIMGIMQNWIGT